MCVGGGGGVGSSKQGVCMGGGGGVGSSERGVCEWVGGRHTPLLIDGQQCVVAGWKER